MATSIMWVSLFLVSTFTIAGMLRGGIAVSLGSGIFLVSSAAILFFLAFRLNTWWRFILGIWEDDPRG